MMNRRSLLAALASIFPGALLFCFKPEKRATVEQESLKWGTYGKDACHYPHIEWKCLKDCESDHLLAILRTQDQITEEYFDAITNILLDRGISCAAISRHTSSFLASKMSSVKSLRPA